MIRVYTGAQVGGGGREHFRSATFWWPNLSGTSSTSVYINHNLGTFGIDYTLYYTNNGGVSVSNPYDYRYDQNVDWTASTMGHLVYPQSRDQVRVYLYRYGAGGYGMIDIYALEDIPGL